MTIIVSLSGGLDSTAALHRAVATGAPTRAVALSYGQRHARELDAARAVAHAHGVPLTTRDLEGLLAGGALLGDADVPHGHYAADTMAVTVVPGRNLLLVAAVVATASPGDQVWIGVHAGDHYVYPDCRPAFVDPLASAVAAAYEVTLVAPWLHLRKDQIISACPDAPYHLSWSCYTGADRHCGRCGTCVERAEAFALAGVPDPTAYDDPTYWRVAVAAAAGE